jgi:protein-S-isoprenylcysteine O-methyltransferase Ste14
MNNQENQRLNMKSKSTKKENKNKISSYWDKFAEHEHRPDIAGEHRYGDLFQGLFFILFIGVVIIDRLFLKTSAVISPCFPIWARIPIAILILVLAWHLAVGGLRIVFGEIRKKPVVMNQGVFSQTRHPIYLGAILMYLAALVLTLSLTAAVIWVFIILYYWFLARFEEKLLIEKFGDEYRLYMHQVPMWIPRPKT